MINRWLQKRIKIFLIVLLQVSTYQFWVVSSEGEEEAREGELVTRLLDHTQSQFVPRRPEEVR